MFSNYCIQYDKDISLKANHNAEAAAALFDKTVFNMTKI